MQHDDPQCPVLLLLLLMMMMILYLGALDTCLFHA
jgi:hypothetical protein